MTSKQLPPRPPFLGVSNVVRFNWPMFAGGVAFSFACLLGAAAIRRPRWVRPALALGGAGGLWQTLASLAVTHWVYDRSRLYGWEWLRDLFAVSPTRITNVHSGFDESSDALRVLFPDATLRVLDFYDPSRNTEPSIARARRIQPSAARGESISPDAWPVESASQDLVLFFFAAHEARSREERADLFREAARTLASDGRVVLVEHLRNVPNFLAYGPGAFHFHSRGEWLRAFRTAGLKLQREFAITPFVRVFVCCHSCSKAAGSC